MGFLTSYLWAAKVQFVSKLLHIDSHGAIKNTLNLHFFWGGGLAAGVS